MTFRNKLIRAVTVLIAALTVACAAFVWTTRAAARDLERSLLAYAGYRDALTL